MQAFTIGKLARAAGVGVETVRFYERRGLIRRPAAQTGYRQYTGEDARRIRFVRRAQGLGFTLKEIKAVLDLNSGARVTCGDIRRRADDKLREVESKIRDLRRMKRSLERLSKACGEGKKAVADCPVLDCFESDGNC